MTAQVVDAQRLSRRAIIVTAPFAALLLGAWAQNELDKGRNLESASIVFITAAALFAFAMREISIERDGTGAIVPSTESYRLLWIGFALGLAGVTFFASAGNQFRIVGVLAWLGSLALFFCALPHSNDWGNAWARLRSRSLPKQIVVRWETVALVAITLVGAFFRLYQLDLIPAEMGCDLPLKYDNVQEILNGNYLVFFPSHPGREALFFYWTAILAKLLGLSHLTIKFSAAVIGILTIPVLYLVVKHIYNVEAGLYAALMLALSHYHIIQSRIGFRAILVPLFTIVLLYLMARICRNHRAVDFALAGFWIGLGLYTYNAWFIAPLTFVIALLAYWVAMRSMSFVTLVRGVVIAGLAAFLVWVPLARYGYEHPEMYLQRVATRVTETEAVVSSNVAGIFADNLRRTFLMLNYRGDPVFIQNVPFMRELGFVPAILFVLGLGYILIRWRHGSNPLVALLFAVMLLPSALAIAFPAEVPNVNRSGGGIAMAILIAALPLPLIRKQLAEFITQVRQRLSAERFVLVQRDELHIEAKLSPGKSTAWMIPLIAVLLFCNEARNVYKTYFDDYVAALPSHNYSITLEMARALDDFAGNGFAIIKIWPNWYDGNAVRVQLHKMPKEGYREVDRFDLNAPPFANFQGTALFLINPGDAQGLDLLHKSFPRGVTVEYRDPMGQVQSLSFYGQK
jgi:4-amino-4-deoxy-L-arabinose transferase-like glycosyltransferase